MVVEPDGTQYYIQVLNEMDKNHGIEDDEKNNEGRMYATNGKNLSKILCNLI